MDCKVCGYDDKYVKSNYCKACGRKFSDEERKEAYGRTIYGKIDKLINAKGWITLSKITENIFVRIAILLVLAALVIFNITSNGSELAIRNSADYSLTYCQQTDEYYLFTEKDSVSLSVYVPRKTDSCVLETYVNGTLEEKLELSKSSSVVVKCRENSYFLLKANYESGDREEILFFVCPEAAS